MKMRFPGKLFLITIYMLIVPYCSVFATTKLPTDEDINGVVLACSESRTKSIEGDLEGAIKLWRQQAEVRGTAEINDLGRIILSFKNEELRLEAYKIYTNCLKDTLKKFVSGNSEFLCIEENRSFKTHILGIRDRVKFSCPNGKITRHKLNLEVSKSGDLGFGKGSARVEKVEGTNVTVYHWMDPGTHLKYHLKAWAIPN